MGNDAADLAGRRAPDDGRGIVAKATRHVGNTLTADVEDLFARPLQSD